MRALVKITTSIKTYSPGDTLGEEFSEKDIKRLVKLKAVEGSYELDDSDNELFNVQEPLIFMTEDELNKLKKPQLVEYSLTIGIEGLTEKESKEELISSILNYIQELEDQEE